MRELGDTRVCVRQFEFPGVSLARLDFASLGAPSAPPEAELGTFAEYDAEVSLWMGWRKQMQNALPDECDIPEHPAYLAAFDGKLLREMTTEEIRANHQEVREAKVK